MNLIMAIMVNQMDMDEAEAMLQKHRVEEIIDKIEFKTFIKRIGILTLLKKFGFWNSSKEERAPDGNMQDKEKNPTPVLVIIVAYSFESIINPCP